MHVDSLTMSEPLKVFASATAVESQEHIKPFHRHIALRLVLEGGFLPEEITPHPPLRLRQTPNGPALEFDPAAETVGEMTVFGGMKTKQIDVVVAKHGIGPVLAVSVKGTLNAYRNLVNRMEEAIGDSTNVHVMYPGLVYGFLHLLRANRQAGGYGPRDAGVCLNGEVSPLIRRYSTALCEMTGRRFVRNDHTRYEAVGLALVENEPASSGAIHTGFPDPASPLRIETFFARLYEVYDLRFPSRAERLPLARRAAWSPESPFLQDLTATHGKALEEILGYSPRLTA